MTPGLQKDGPPLRLGTSRTFGHYCTPDPPRAPCPTPTGPLYLVFCAFCIPSEYYPFAPSVRHVRARVWHEWRAHKHLLTQGATTKPRQRCCPTSRNQSPWQDRRPWRPSSSGHLLDMADMRSLQAGGLAWPGGTTTHNHSRTLTGGESPFLQQTGECAHAVWSRARCRG